MVVEKRQQDDGGAFIDLVQRYTDRRPTAGRHCVESHGIVSRRSVVIGDCWYIENEYTRYVTQYGYVSGGMETRTLSET